MNKKMLTIVGVIVAVLLLVILILPSLIDANRYKPEIQAKLGTALGRNVQIGNIKLSIFSGGVVVDDVAISDDPAFSNSQFLAAKELTVGVHLIPLIFSKQLEVESITIKDPQVTLLRNKAGVWNYSSMGGGASKTEAKAPSSPSSASSANSLSVGKIEITNGKISVGNVGSRAKPLIYQDVNLTVTDLSYTSQFPFKLSAKDPGNGALKVEGKAGPIDQTDASLTPLNATIDVQHLDIATFGGFASPSAGIAGLMDFNGSLTSDGKQMSSKGTVKTTKLKLSAAGTPSTVPVNVDYDTDYQLKSQSGVLKQGDIHVGKALARLTGTYNIAGETPTVQLKMNGQAMSVPDLEGVLPAVGVTLPSGSALTTGTLDANLAIAGPTDKLVITGPIKLVNGTIKGFSVSSKLGALGSFAGLGGNKSSDTVIESLTTNVRVEPAGTHAQNLNVVIQGIGSVTGDANVDAAGKLDCKMVAHVSGGALGGMSQVASVASLPLGGGGKGNDGGIPFRVTGTTSNPVFVPDVAGVAGGLAKGGVGAALGGGKALGGAAGGATGGAAGALGGLLGKKK